jgi:hypothetical protein
MYKAKPKSTGTKKQRAAYAALWYQKKKGTPKFVEQTKARDIRKNFGITLESYNQHFKQANGCKICGRNDNLVLDHDHSKHGEESIRGVICQKHNIALGHVGDNLKGLENTYIMFKKYFLETA